MLHVPRRSFLLGAFALTAAPAIVRGSDGIIKVWDHCSCDGATPDADALQYVFDLARTQGKNVQFPARKSILVEKPVVAWMGDCIIEGANSLIINGSLNQPALFLGNAVDVIGGNTVNNLRFSQRALAPGESVQPGNVGLLAIKQSKLTLHKVWALKHPSSLYEGIKVHDLVNGSRLTGLHADTAVLNGITTTNCQDLWYRDNTAHACGRTGHLFNDNQGVYGSGSGGYGNGLHAIELSSVGLNQNAYFFWESWGGDTSGSANIKITHLRSGWFGHTWAASQKNRAVNPGAPGIEISGPYVHKVHFATGATYNNNGPGTAVVATEGGAPDLCSWGDDFEHGSVEFPNGVGTVNGQQQVGNRVGIWFSAMGTKHTVGGKAAGNPDGAIQAAFAPNVVLRPNFP